MCIRDRVWGERCKLPQQGLGRSPSGYRVWCILALKSDNDSTATKPGAAAQKTAQNKIDKYSKLASTHIFYPFAIETAGTWHEMAIELTQEIGRRITTIIEDTRETTFLFQRLSVALQRGNAVSFHNTMVTVRSKLPLQP